MTSLAVIVELYQMIYQKRTCTSTPFYHQPSCGLIIAVAITCTSDLHVAVNKDDVHILVAVNKDMCTYL